jgi:hypothetical protein
LAAGQLSLVPQSGRWSTRPAGTRAVAGVSSSAHREFLDQQAGYSLAAVRTCCHLSTESQPTSVAPGSSPFCLECEPGGCRRMDGCTAQLCGDPHSHRVLRRRRLLLRLACREPGRADRKADRSFRPQSGGPVQPRPPVIRGRASRPGSARGDDPFLSSILPQGHRPIGGLGYQMAAGLPFVLHVACAELGWAAAC